MSETLHREQVGHRLRAAIEALSITQAAVGNALGVSPSKLGNWLRGVHYPSAWFVKLFCDRYGITTDWIYRGVVSGIDSALADALWQSQQSAPSGPADSLQHKPKTGHRERAPPNPTPGEQERRKITRAGAR